MDCIRLLETLKPKTFNHYKWHKLMTTHMLEITEAEKKKEAEERDKNEEAIRA